MSIDPITGLPSGNSDLTSNQSKSESSSQETPPQEETQAAEKKPSSKEEYIVKTFLDSDLAAAHPEKAQKVEENQEEIEKGLGVAFQIQSNTEKSSDSAEQKKNASIDAYNTTVSEEDKASGNDTSASKESSKSKKPQL